MSLLKENETGQDRLLRPNAVILAHRSLSQKKRVSSRLARAIEILSGKRKQRKKKLPTNHLIEKYKCKQQTKHQSNTFKRL